MKDKFTLHVKVRKNTTTHLEVTGFTILDGHLYVYKDDEIVAIYNEWDYVRKAAEVG